MPKYLKAASVAKAASAVPSSLAPYKLISQAGEQAFTDRQKLSVKMEKLSSKLALLKKQRDELDLQLEPVLPLGEPMKLRDGTVVERVVTPVQATVATLAWYKEHKNQIIRAGYNRLTYKVASPVIPKM